MGTFLLLKYLFWGIYGVEVIENGIEPYSMLDLGEKYWGSSIYQIWLDELAKGSGSEEKKKGFKKEEGYLMDEVYPYLEYKSNKGEMEKYFNEVFNSYKNSSNLEEFEEDLYNKLYTYLTEVKGASNPDEFRELLTQKIGMVPDIDLADILRLSALVEHRGSFLLKMDLNKLDVTDDEKKIYFRSNPGYFMAIPYWERRLDEKLQRFEEGYRYFYNRVREKEYLWKKKYSPIMVYYMEDGMPRSREGNYYIEAEYRTTWPHFKSVDEPNVYLRYRVPRRVDKRFFEFYRQSWLKRDLVHVSNYMEPLQEYQEKLRYRLLDYYLERAERKYFYQLMSSMPSMYQYYEVQKERKSNKHVPREKRRKELELGYDPVKRGKSYLNDYFRRRYKKKREPRRLTWLRRMKRYTMAEYSSRLKLKKRLRLAIEEENERGENGIRFGTRFKYKRKKIALRDPSVHYKLPRLKGTYPSFYVKELAPGYYLYRGRQFVLPGDGTQFPRRSYERLRRAFYVVHIEFFLRDKGYEDYSFYEKWLFRKCYQYRTLGKGDWNTSYPVMWPAYNSNYYRSNYMWKEYLPAPYWIADTGSLQRLKFDPKDVKSKSWRRDWWTGRLIKERGMRKKRSNWLKSIRKGFYWDYGKGWMERFKQLLWLPRSKHRKLRLAQRVEKVMRVLEPRLVDGLQRFGSRGWFTSFRVPAYKDLTIDWIIYYGIKGFWLETHFGTYLKVLFSSVIYVIAVSLGGLVPYVILIWFLMLLLLVGTMIYMVRKKEELVESEDWLGSMKEEEFVYLHFKTNYRYKDLDWSSLGKGWRMSNFYLMDKSYYNVYGRSLFKFLKEYREDFGLFFNSVIRFLFLLLIGEILVGAVAISVWYLLGVGV